MAEKKFSNGDINESRTRTYPCVICHHPSNRMCGSCISAHYCSSTCQAQDWRHHRNHCVGLAAMQASECGAAPPSLNHKLAAEYCLTDYSVTDWLILADRIRPSTHIISLLILNDNSRYSRKARLAKDFSSSHHSRMIEAIRAMPACIVQLVHNPVVAEKFNREVIPSRGLKVVVYEEVFDSKANLVLKRSASPHPVVGRDTPPLSPPKIHANIRINFERPIWELMNPGIDLGRFVRGHESVMVIPEKVFGCGVSIMVDNVIA